MTGLIRADIYFPHSFCDAVMALMVTWAGSCQGWPHLHTRLRGRKTAWNHAAWTMASSLYHVGGCKKRLGEHQKSADFCNISWYPWQPSAEVWTPLKGNLISSSRDQLSRLNNYSCPCKSQKAVRKSNVCHKIISLERFYGFSFQNLRCH